jgi:hypothetical protein
MLVQKLKNRYIRFMKKLIGIFLGFILSLSIFAQTNLISTNPLAEQIMLGNYNPNNYLPNPVISNPDVISQDILNRVSSDSLKSFIVSLAGFRNRNSGSDTVSNTQGIGGARRWIYSKFQQFSALNQNRLIPSYLQFDLVICSMGQHRMPFCVLPGSDTTDKSIIIIEGHMDSRCEGLCDITCNAQGVEDNATGTAMVMELARVMSKYSFKQTIVFLITIGEEQGLYGADAFGDYVLLKGIAVKAVQNNDVSGGVICGQTSSAPSCPGLNSIDSLNVRLFSQGSINSKHKGYCRFMKLQYQEQLLPFVPVPMTINILAPEDRTGRSGDHVPFRQKGFTAMRMTAANEHGDAGVTNPGYTDRQHTTRDTLGVDTNNDLVVDSFFVDFNYLARNTVINGNCAAMCALGPKKPDFVLSSNWNNEINVLVTQQTQYGQYRVGVRTTTHDWDTVFTMTNTLNAWFTLPTPSIYYVSIMSVDTDSIESLPSTEYTINLTSVQDQNVAPKPIQLMQNRPNPFDDATYIEVLNESGIQKKGMIRITDITGKQVFKEIQLELNPGMNEVLYEHGYGVTGILTYTLIIDGKILDSKQMIFAN